MKMNSAIGISVASVLYCHILISLSHGDISCVNTVTKKVKRNPKSTSSAHGLKNADNGNSSNLLKTTIVYLNKHLIFLKKKVKTIDSYS